MVTGGLEISILSGLMFSNMASCTLMRWPMRPSSLINGAALCRQRKDVARARWMLMCGGEWRREDEEFMRVCLLVQFYGDRIRSEALTVIKRRKNLVGDNIGIQSGKATFSQPHWWSEYSKEEQLSFDIGKDENEEHSQSKTELMPKRIRETSSRKRGGKRKLRRAKVKNSI